MADQSAFPTAVLGRAAPIAFPDRTVAFPGSTPDMQRARQIQQLAKANPNLVRSLPNIPLDLLPQGK